MKILKAIANFDIFWGEIDSYSPAALGYIRRQSPHPISSCETRLGLREFLPYFREQAMDVAPHNFYGHLATMMNAHFAAAVPNLRIMEVDIDRLAWDEQVFTVVPQFENGQLIVL